jgi:3-hydroxybutyryl-CoA dehydratase
VPEARTFEQIGLGDEASSSLVVTAALIDAFVAISGDASPIHVDAAAARERGWPDRVAHGALLVGLVSGLVGTRLPGARGVLQSLSMKFRRPCCVGQRIEVSVRVREKIESVRTLVLDARVRDESGSVLAEGSFQSGVVEPAAERHGDR